MTGRWTRGALALGAIALIAAALAATAAARVDARGAATAKTVNVGFLYPKTGGLSAFGQEEYDGFQAGLAYTKGKCGGYTINPTYIDDATDPATAITAFKSLVGQGIKIIGGHRLVGHRAAARPAGRAEQRPVHRRGGGERRHHRLEQEHVPRRAADAAGRARRSEHLPAQVDRQEDRRLRRGHRLRPGELRGRPT